MTHMTSPPPTASEPHEYQKTERGGCALCGVGPGAALHSTSEIRRTQNSAADPLHELGVVLWFLASLVLDHEPLCAFKQGEACDCQKLVPDDDPWAARIRASLQLVSKLRHAQTVRAILSCSACGTSLRAGEMMVCAPCQQNLETKVEYLYTSAAKKPD